MDVFSPMGFGGGGEGRFKEIDHKYVPMQVKAKVRGMLRGNV